MEAAITLMSLIMLKELLKKSILEKRQELLHGNNFRISVTSSFIEMPRATRSLVTIILSCIPMCPGFKRKGLNCLTVEAFSFSILFLQQTFDDLFN